jgi:nucleoid-associated protein YgaU
MMPVAAQTDEQPKSTRRKKELDQTKQKLKTLELEREALTKALLDLETECAAVKDQVQTLTWANEVLVKELEAAYRSRETGTTGLLPEGSRGIYVLRAGESLSRVAKAFYGDAGRWRDLVEANKDKIPDPDMVKAGTIIVIPE